MGKTKIWRFVNQKDSLQIIIHDLTSAKTLASVLKRDRHAKWEILQESSEEAPPSGPTPVERSVEIQQTISPMQARTNAPSTLRPTGQNFEIPTSEMRLPDAIPPPAPMPVPVPVAVKSQKSESRRHQRFKRRFRVMLIADNRTFKTYSSDLSLGGMRLEKNVPQTIVGRTCRVLLGRMDAPENIEIHCELLGDTSEPNRMRFTGLDSKSAKILQNWIDESVSQNVA